MPLSLEDINDQEKFRLILTIPYSNLIQFVFEYLKKKSILIYLYLFLCFVFLCIAVYIRIKVAGCFPFAHILFHSVTGMIILPVICIPVHEFLHIVPYYISGARNIRIGMDLKQYLFYVTADKYIANPIQFRIVAWTPFFIISTGLVLLVCLLPGLWKWSLSVFLFAHATMCAGDFALLNLYYINKDKKIYTWDDFDKKEAYFYEDLQ
jgi:Putative zincin peptidase